MGQGAFPVGGQPPSGHPSSGDDQFTLDGPGTNDLPFLHAINS